MLTVSFLLFINVLKLPFKYIKKKKLIFECRSLRTNSRRHSNGYLLRARNMFKWAEHLSPNPKSLNGPILLPPSILERFLERESHEVKTHKEKHSLPSILHHF